MTFAQRMENLHHLVGHIPHFSSTKQNGTPCPLAQPSRAFSRSTPRSADVRDAANSGSPCCSRHSSVSLLAPFGRERRSKSTICRFSNLHCHQTCGSWPFWFRRWRSHGAVGRKGTYYLFILLPIVGWIMLFIQLVKDSQPGANAFGEPVK